MSDKDERCEKKEAQEVKEILNVVSTEIPAMIKGLLASVFSEEAGRNMGKAAAAYYRQLKEGGLPSDVAVELTEDYMKTFTSFGDIFKNIGRGNSFSRKAEDVLEDEIDRRIREKIERKRTGFSHGSEE